MKDSGDVKTGIWDGAMIKDGCRGPGCQVRDDDGKVMMMMKDDDQGDEG